MRLINIISLVLAAAVFLCSCQSSKTKDVNGIYRISEPLSAVGDEKIISFAEYGGKRYLRRRKEREKPSYLRLFGVGYLGRRI